MIMDKSLDWVHHDSKTFDEEQFMENIERKYIEKHTSHIEGFTKDYVNKLLEEKDKEIEILKKEKSILEKSLKLIWKKDIKIDYEELDKANKIVEKAVGDDNE